jgi:N-acyl-D-amino-acid deacylase
MRISKPAVILATAAFVLSLAVMVGAAGSALGGPTNHDNLATQVLLGGRVYTMDPDHPRATAVAFRDGQILAVGKDNDMRRYIGPLTEVRDVHGLEITPGFIDPHMHLREGMVTGAAYVRMGVTTITTGLCGGSDADIAKFIADTNATGFAPNVLTYIGANTLRAAVGVRDEYTAAKPKQIREMVALADQAMKDGAIGVSFGTEYEPGQSYEEIAALARVAAAHKGHISSHIRYPNPIPSMLYAVIEIMQAGKDAGCPVQISHLASMVYGEMPESLAAIAAARANGQDVTADTYPYDAWATGIKSAVFDDPSDWDFTYSDIEVVTGPYAGRRLTEALFNELRSLPENTTVAVHNIPWGDVLMCYRSPFVMVGSDGSFRYNSITNAYQGHPRGAGTFPRVLGKLVREDGILTLEQALFKMTVMPAVRLQLYRKGMLKPGFDADIVVFDKDTIIDTATFGDNACYTPPIGIDSVYVNGRLTVKGQEYLGTMAGKALAHKEIPTLPVPVTPGQ